MDHVKPPRRGWRRHHRERLKARRARDHADFITRLPAQDHPRAIGRVLATPKSCSCWMCGNPRAHQHERTRQEDEADRLLKEAIEVWDPGDPA